MNSDAREHALECVRKLIAAVQAHLADLRDAERKLMDMPLPERDLWNGDLQDK